MSTLKAEVVSIEAIEPHPNADRLELIVIRGWRCVSQKGIHQVGGLAIYLPIDSILPEWLEARLFPEGSKVKLHQHRIRSIKLRGAISQGMLVQIQSVVDKLPRRIVAGLDVTEALGITKHEPPEPGYQLVTPKKGTPKQINPHFRKYTDIENIKNYNKVFLEGDEVYISEKMHGTSARYARLPRECAGLWQRLSRFVLKSLGRYDEFEFVYGSRNVQLHTGTNQSWYEENIYAKIIAQHDIVRGDYWARHTERV